MDGSDGDRVAQQLVKLYIVIEALKQCYRMMPSSLGETVTGLVSLNRPMTALCSASIVRCSALCSTPGYSCKYKDPFTTVCAVTFCGRDRSQRVFPLRNLFN